MSKVNVFKEDFNILKSGFTFIHKYVFGDELLTDVVLLTNNWCVERIFPNSGLLRKPYEYTPLYDFCGVDNGLNFLSIMKERKKLILLKKQL